MIPTANWVLTRPLRAQLKALNPGLPDTAYDDSVRQITATDASQGIAAANRDKCVLNPRSPQRRFERRQRPIHLLLRVVVGEPDTHHPRRLVDAEVPDDLQGIVVA